MIKDPSPPIADAARIGQLSPDQLERLLRRLQGGVIQEDPERILAVARSAAGAPLSFAQEQLWFLDQLRPGNAAYNVPTAFRLRGPLAAEVLARSLTEIVRRHEILRTVFTAVDGRAVQVVAAAAGL
ncbi:MAG TPA: condensation domain-containing protein, partial [Thermoanaerobaculia bacterium]|nr:condensation domain-containing protein [Thermoanaerobaculia bacterium]